MNIYGVPLGACEYCGFCGRNACEANAKAATPTHIMPALRSDPKFELRTRAFVSKLVYDKAGKTVTGVLYTDMKPGEEYRAAGGNRRPVGFVFSNTHMMLYSGIGEPYDNRTRRGGQELLLSVRSARDPLLRETRISIPSWARPATAR